MNKSFVGILILLLLLAGGGVLYFATKNTEIPEELVVVSPVVKDDVDANTKTETTLKAGIPVVITSTTTFTSDNTAMVIGAVNPMGAFTAYWYEYGVTSNLGNKTVNQTVGSGFSSIQSPGYITNLTKNTNYYFRLVAENQYGRATGNQFTFKTTLGISAPEGSTPIVKTLSASAISRNSAYLNGEVTSNRVITQYWFEYGKTRDLGSISVLSTVSDAKSSVSKVVIGLEPLTTYYFRLNAQNQFGTKNGVILSFRTEGPSAYKAPSVTTGNATELTSSGAILHGTVTPNLADTKYWFEYGTDSSLRQSSLKTTERVSVGSGGVVISVDKVVTDLKQKTNYYFRIVAENSQGTVRGDKASFKTK